MIKCSAEEIVEIIKQRIDRELKEDSIKSAYAVEVLLEVLQEIEN